MKSLVLNAMRLQSMRAQAGIVSRQAQVTGYDPNNYAVKVLIQPEGISSGWLPLASPWIGNSWGFFAPPSINDLCAVEFIDGDIEAGYVEARFYNNAQRPLAVPSGEFWIVHASGAYFKLTNQGAATFSDGQGATVTLQNGNITSQASQWTHTGPVTFESNVMFEQNVNVAETLTATTDVVQGSGGAAISLKGHTHPTAATGAPSPPTPGT